MFWNGIRFANPFLTTETLVLQFLFFLYKSGKSYSVVNTHKAMLLQTLPFLGNSWCSNAALINRFMKGLHSEIPPKPRYIFTWAVSLVLITLKAYFHLRI